VCHRHPAGGDERQQAAEEGAARHVLIDPRGEGHGGRVGGVGGKTVKVVGEALDVGVVAADVASLAQAEAHAQGVVQQRPVGVHRHPVDHVVCRHHAAATCPRKFAPRPQVDVEEGARRDAAAKRSVAILAGGAVHRIVLALRRDPAPRRAQVGVGAAAAVAALQAAHGRHAIRADQVRILGKVLFEAAKARVGAHLQDGRKPHVAARGAQLQSIGGGNLLDERRVEGRALQARHGKDGGVRCAARMRGLAVNRRRYAEPRQLLQVLAHLNGVGDAGHRTASDAVRIVFCHVHRRARPDVIAELRDLLLDGHRRQE